MLNFKMHINKVRNNIKNENKHYNNSEKNNF